MTMPLGFTTLRLAPWLCAAAFFGVVLYLNVRVLPVIPWNGDDWAYLAQFRDMFPSLTRWNPARILPEVLHPLLGWLASIIYTFSGQYVDALVWSHALALATGITALAVALYVALRSLTQDAALALFAVILCIALSFSVFKSRPADNIHLFFSESLTVTTFYVWPNLLNSILVCYILHGHVRGTARHSCAGGGSLRAGCILAVIFLAQFSMTFGSAIAAVFAGWLCLWRLWRQPVASLRHKIVHYAKTGTFFDALLLTIMFFWILAAVLDMCGGRYDRIAQTHWNITGAWNAFAALLAQINPATCVVLIVLCMATLTRWTVKYTARTWNSTDSMYAGLVLMCLLSAGAFWLMDMLISARTFALIGRINVAYNSIFCLILGATLCACYLMQDIPCIKLVAPLILAMLLVECQNAEKPWARQPFEYRIVVQRWLDDIHKAEHNGESAVTITVPKAEWPHPPPMFGKALSNALFAHGVTTGRMTITLREAAR